MYTTIAKIKQIVPLHEVRDEEKLNNLIQSMEETGWCGRPLVVIDCGNEYRALTGSHRIAAAIKAGLAEIPIACIEYGTMFEDYDMTSDDLRDPEQIKKLLEEYDEEAAELYYDD